MPVREQRDDAEPVKISGKPLPFAELIAIAMVTSQDLSAALDRFSDAVPPRYRELLD